MRTPFRFAATLLASAVLSLLSSCGSNGRQTIAASQSLAGNWDFSATVQPSSASQIGHLGGAVLVSSTGAITGTLHALPVQGADASSLCFPMMSNIAVTGTLTSDNTLTLISSPFDGNMLTVRGTYVAGSAAQLPSMANATYAITGPCAVSTQAAAASQEPVASGNYSGTATMHVTGVFGPDTPFVVPFTAVFSNVTSPPAGVSNPNGFYTVSVVVTFAQDLCASSPASFTASGFSVGTNLSISFTDAATGTAFSAGGVLEKGFGQPVGTEYAFNPLTVKNSNPTYASCNYFGTAGMDLQTPS